MRIVNNEWLAFICSDIENVQYYKIEGNQCYYKNKLIGEISEKFDQDNNILNIFYKPLVTVDYITVDFNISKEGTEF